MGSKKKANIRASSEPPTQSTQQQQPDNPTVDESGREAQTQSKESKKREKVSSLTRQQKIVNIITKFSFATKGGISSHNPYKVNQDAYITNPHIMGLKHCHFFSVCDGHGSNGRDVSSFLKHRLPMFIESHLQV